MIILRHGKFISGFRIFQVGEILPDTDGVQELVRKGIAENIEAVKKPKTTKKPEPDKVDTTQENVKSNP